MNKFKHRIAQHFYASWWIYLFVALCFLAGVIFGSLGVNALDDQQAVALKEYVEKGLAQYGDDLNFSLTVRQAMFKNLYNLGKIFVFGLTIIGLPLVLLIIFTRGFALGFTIVFLIQEKAWRGGILAMLAIIPPNLLSLPAYFLAAVTAINFSLYLLKGNKGPNPLPLSQYLLGYLLVNAGLTLLMAGSALIEGYLSPVFMSLFASLIIPINHIIYIY